MSTDYMMPEMSSEMIDAFFSPYDHEMPDIPLIKTNTLGVSGMGGYTWDAEHQRSVFSTHGLADEYVPPYQRHLPGAPQNRTYAEDVKRVDDDDFKRSQRDGPGSSSYDGSSARNGGVDAVSSRLDTMTISTDSARGGAAAADGGGAVPKGAAFQKNRNPAEFYSQEFFTKSHRYGHLPIVDHRQTIVNAIEGNSIVLIKGSTGSGKTTQVPQFLLDDATEKRRPCNVVVTQPRKIAARSVAERVCHERQWELGSVCGYQVGLDRKASDDTCILYCTAGVLLQKLINDKSLNEFTHIILDEIHEREADLDFLLLIVKKLQRTVSGQVKIVLMSATMDSQIFSDYFTQYMAGELHPCPVIDVEGRMFDVNEYYLDQLEPLAEQRVDYPDYATATLNEDCCHIAVKLIAKFEEMEKKEEMTRRRNRELNIRHGKRGGEADTGSSSAVDSSSDALAEDDENRFRGSVLVFLPGLAEINKLEALLAPHKKTQHYVITVLHSAITLSHEDWRAIFSRPPPLKRKVILSTNIAESSITVPDVRYVIDFCLTRNLFCDPHTSYPSLRLEWASKSNCDQRRGRAGRVANGRCYRMVPARFYEELDAHGPPEMQRAPLQQLILKAKILDLGDPKQLLGLALSPPNLDDIERTMLCLREVWALTNDPTKKNSRPRLNPRFDGQLTFVGRVMAQIPLDVHLTKLILLGHVFGVLEEAIIMAASLNLGGFFRRPFKEDIPAFMTQLSWTNESNSDVIGMLNAYIEWKKCNFHLPKDYEKEREWGVVAFINVHRIKEVDQLVGELTKRLERFNIVPVPADAYQVTGVIREPG